MAVHWEVECKRGGDLHMFYPADIVIKPELNGRYDPPNVEGLIASILKKGQLQPALVRQENGRPVLIAGFSRWTAISEINKRNLTDDPMMLKCTYLRCNETDGYEANWHENHARKETTAMDDAHYFQQLEQRGLTPEEIADKLSLSAAFVKERLALNELEPEVQEAVSTGKVGLTAAKRLKKLSAEQQRAKVKANGNGKITAKALDKAAGKISKPSFKALREYVEQFDGPGIDDETREVVRKIIAFMDGK